MTEGYAAGRAPIATRSLESPAQSAAVPPRRSSPILACTACGEDHRVTGTPLDDTIARSYGRGQHPWGRGNDVTCLAPQPGSHTPPPGPNSDWRARCRSAS